MATLKESINELRANPKKMAMVVFLIILIFAAVYMNLEDSTSSPETGSISSLESKRTEYQNILKERKVLMQRFVNNVQPRAASFLVTPRTSKLAADLQGMVRTLAGNANYNIAVVNTPRSTKSTAKGAQIDIWEVPFSGIDTWENTLKFLAVVETSFPNFYWGKLDLSKQGKEEKIHLDGALKLVLVHDAQLGKVLKPSIETIKNRLQENDPTFIDVNPGADEESSVTPKVENDSSRMPSAELSSEDMEPPPPPPFMPPEATDAKEKAPPAPRYGNGSSRQLRPGSRSFPRIRRPDGTPGTPSRRFPTRAEKGVDSQ